MEIGASNQTKRKNLHFIAELKGALAFLICDAADYPL